MKSLVNAGTVENYLKTTSGVNLEIAKNSGMGFKAKGEAGPLIFRLEMLFSSSPGMSALMLFSSSMWTCSAPAEK
jgi:hypothetical protein